MAEPVWIPLRQYAEARGVTADAALKAIRRGRLGLPYRRSNVDGRGTYEVQVDLDDLVKPQADLLPTARVPAPSVEVEVLRGHLAAVEAERDRLLAERDQERTRLEQERADRAQAETRFQAQLTAISGRLAELAREASRVGITEAEAGSLKVELDRLKGRGWLARLLNL